ncbi:BglII/BstYI family type II restriction endonuclease [Desulfovibrio psychrotolerans]|uniref:Restriction endonuclease n=1 Tax=Desulfovibrio psychrotolerans TaxID=415242 RepID=A0A7J0BT61_9BACT|nr:BglII/BstYI family type II restriction endonuclease [Desulfovibrio psychrotolerans]GFM36899.1 hypothetical protein DSM19430T_15830 [Desulfovibrio psychrotolerans]
MLTRYEVFDYKNALSVLNGSFYQEFSELCNVLSGFRLLSSDIVAAGGRKSPIAEKLDGALYNMLWIEKQFETSKIIDGVVRSTPTHKIDCYKNKVAIEVEWNNKDPFFDRDLNNFRLLYDLDAISVGIIITRSDELQLIFNGLGKGASYGASTTHMSKLIPKIIGGGAGGCPVLVIGITSRCYEYDL